MLCAGTSGQAASRGLHVSVGESLKDLARNALHTQDSTSALTAEERQLIRTEILREESSLYRTTETDAGELRRKKGETLCSLAALRALRKALQTKHHDASSPVLMALRDDHGMVIKATPSERTPRSALMAKRREWLRARQADRKYFEMVKDVSGSDPRLARLHGQGGSRSSSVGQTLREMSHGINLAVGCGTAFTVAYFLAHNSYALFGRRYNHGQALMWGLGAAIAMMIVEISLYIVRATRYDAGKDRQRRAREADLSRRAMRGVCSAEAAGEGESGEKRNSGRESRKRAGMKDKE